MPNLLDAHRKLPVSELLERIRRALRNGTGTSFSPADLRLMAEYGVLHMLLTREADEIVASFKNEDTPPPEARERPVYSVKTLAERWTCSEGMVRNMITRGELKAFRYGNLIRIKREAVEELESRREPKAP